jgi:hypothetical protein
MLTVTHCLEDGGWSLLPDLLRERLFAQLVAKVESQLRFPVTMQETLYVHRQELVCSRTTRLYWEWSWPDSMNPECLDVGMITRRVEEKGKVLETRTDVQMVRARRGVLALARAETVVNKTLTTREVNPHWLGVMRTYDEDGGWTTIWPDQWWTDSDEDPNMM